MISPQTSYRLDNRNYAGGAKESDEQKITLIWPINESFLS